MTKQIEAVYEQGVFRPLEPVELPEGARLDIVLITPEKQKGGAAGQTRRHFGAWDSGSERSADNDRIDAALAREYASENEAAS